jgi:hypothetical protein
MLIATLTEVSAASATDKKVTTAMVRRNGAGFSSPNGNVKNPFATAYFFFLSAAAGSVGIGSGMGDNCSMDSANSKSKEHVW